MYLKGYFFERKNNNNQIIKNYFEVDGVFRSNLHRFGKIDNDVVDVPAIFSVSVLELFGLLFLFDSMVCYLEIDFR